MKIRIKGNSIRIRLSRSEVDHFGKEGRIEEATEFGDASLTYALVQKQESGPLTARMENNVITMYMSAEDARYWAESERVGYEANMPLGNGKQLYLLLEKDFKCLDNTNEDQSDMYENPLEEGRGRK